MTTIHRVRNFALASAQLIVFAAGYVHKYLGEDVADVLAGFL